MPTLLFNILFPAATAAALLFLDIPTGWAKAGNKPESYEMGIQKGAGYRGQHAATIKSIEKEIRGFGTLMQAVHAGQYAGRRIRMSGYVRTENADTAWLWLRVDMVDSTSQKDSVLRIMHGLDNMHNRPINGTTDWKKYELVIDLPANASYLLFGGGLSGTGQMWFDNLSFEVVSNTTPSTANFPVPAGGQRTAIARDRYQENERNRTRPVSLQPINLDFEE